MTIMAMMAITNPITMLIVLVLGHAPWALQAPRSQATAPTQDRPPPPPGSSPVLPLSGASQRAQQMEPGHVERAKRGEAVTLNALVPPPPPDRHLSHWHPPVLPSVPESPSVVSKEAPAPSRENTAPPPAKQVGVERAGCGYLLGRWRRGAKRRRARKPPPVAP